MEHSLETLHADYELWKKDPALSKIPGIETIATMVIPITSSRDGKEHLYTCKHLRDNGDCGIYERRPQMCRDFPDEGGCHFWKCQSKDSAYFGKNIFQKIYTRYKWLRKIAK